MKKAKKRVGKTKKEVELKAYNQGFKHGMIWTGVLFVVSLVLFVVLKVVGAW